ncbi:MAG: two-component system, NtrC family, sensor kinase [Candidatus Parcubacteria bacterium]|jgi:signal transduction histidine kinase|nr:two-component system, NtrC family, sensor kinase [Candidatus Parcubacteria bacterium]
MSNPLPLFFNKFTFPKSRNEDMARREFILNVLLLGALALLFAAVCIDIADRLFADPVSYAANSLHSAVIYGLFAFFLFLYGLSRRKHVTLASYVLLGTFFALTAYMGYTWGVDVPAQIVFYPLVIVMAGVLISTRVAFFATVLIAATMILTGYLQYAGIVPINAYWKNSLWTWSDVVMIVIIYLIVATVSWLSNREIEKSLRRARRSEAELKQERDTLEVRVEERTRELRQAEMEKMSQAYHFVEFGRLAGGIFHDLMNPLAALSLNIDRIADAPGTRTALSEDIGRAKRAAAHMQKLMESMRRHLSHEKSEEVFSVRDLLENAIHILSSYARTQGVRLSLDAGPDAVMTYGDSTAFTQVVTNLISNAVQSYPLGITEKADGREVVITIRGDASGVRVSVRDRGSGIPEENLANIFEPFFTTKAASKGIGIGLSLAKRITEKDFGGTLTVESRVGQGSAFTVYLPVREL